MFRLCEWNWTNPTFVLALLTHTGNFRLSFQIFVLVKNSWTDIRLVYTNPSYIFIIYSVPLSAAICTWYLVSFPGIDLSYSCKLFSITPYFQCIYLDENVFVIENGHISCSIIFLLQSGTIWRLNDGDNYVFLWSINMPILILGGLCFLLLLQGQIKPF